MIFDETYYAKDGLSLTLFGYERKAVEGADELLLQGRTSIFTDSPGVRDTRRWVAGAGQRTFEVSPAAWRFGSAVPGHPGDPPPLARIVRRMTGSTRPGCIAGLLLALEGLSIVLSRTAMLDAAGLLRAGGVRLPGHRPLCAPAGEHRPSGRGGWRRASASAWPAAPSGRVSSTWRRSA